MTKILVRVVDAYVFMRKNDLIKFLILKRAKTKIYEHLWQGVAGKIEKNEKPWETAVRELKEETGFEGSEVVEIGRVESNPAIMANHTYTYLALNCEKSADQNLDGTEDIEIISKNIDEIPSLIKNREIEHALVISAFYFYNLYRLSENM